MDAAVPAAAAIVRAEPSDSGGAAVDDAMNDALVRATSQSQEPGQRDDSARSERASLANVDESRLETEGAVTYSFS